MAKTKKSRRKVKNSTAFGKNIKTVAVKDGRFIQTSGVRATNDGTVGVDKKTATPIRVERVYTGVNKGKTYPYASKRQTGGRVIGDPKKPNLIERVRNKARTFLG